LNIDITTIDKLAKAGPPSGPNSSSNSGPNIGPESDASFAAATTPIRDRLLLAVAEALNTLLGAGELRDNIGRALQLLGEAAQMHRVKVILDQPEQADRAACHVLTYEWWAPGFESQTSLGVVIFPNEAIPEYLIPLQRGLSFWQWIDEVPASLRDAFEHVGMKSMGVVPIFAKDRYAGLVAFDDCLERRRWSEAEIEALTVAARAIGAVIEREAAENQRESESRRMQGLLEAVNEATRALLAGSDFDAAIGAGMALLGDALGVIRVGMFENLPLPMDAEPGRWRMTHEWAAAGVLAQMGSPAEEGVYPSRDAWQRLRSGEAVIVQVDHTEVSCAEGQRSIQTATILAVPLFVSGQWWGLLGFDQAHEHDWAEHELAVLKTAAACVGAAIERREAESRRIAETDRHAAQLQRHSLLLAAVAQSAEELLATRELARCLDAALGRIGAATSADRAVLVRLDWTPSDHDVLCWQEVLNEWTKPGARRQSDTELQRFAMQRSDPTHAMAFKQLESEGRILMRIEDLGEPFRSEQQSLGITWSLVYPVTVAGALWGLLGFDYATPFSDYHEGDLAALKTAAACVGAALERERHQSDQLASERERADDSARLAGLLQAVVASTRELMVTTDFEAGVMRWLGSFGSATQAIRASLYDMALHEPSGLQSVRMLAEWCRPGISGSIPVTFAEPCVIDPRGAESMMAVVTSGRAAFVHTHEVEEPMRSFLLERGNATVIAVPLLVDGNQQGLISFDHAERREANPHDLAVLQTAADSLSVIMKRIEAERLAAHERDARLALEGQRADEAKGLNHLLEGVVAASRALLEAADFQTGLQHWLAFLAQAVDADRAVYGSLIPPDDPQVIAQASADWVRAGIASAAGLQVPASQDFIDWAGRLQRGEIVWAHRENLVDSVSVRFWEVIDCQTNLIVPVVVDARSIGFLAFDWVTRREWQPAYASVLRTAADGLAAAIKRQEALQALLAERERSANERTAELAQANASMRRTLARLAAAEDVDAFLATSLLELRQQAGAEEAFLFGAGEGDGDALLRLRGSVRADGFQRQSQAGDPPIFASGFVPTAEAMAAMRHGSWLLWRPVASGESLPSRLPTVQRWLQQRGVAADACCLLQVGERCVGLVVLHLASAEPMPSSRCELLVALSQPMALALELGRMGRAAQDTARERAVLAERNRMARDVHDTLAQGFTAISLQLQAAARAENADERARFMARATQEAQANLVESRRTIRLLRGLAEPDGATHTLVHVIEDALASRLSGTSLAWRVLPLPFGVAEPALDEESRRELKRIAQEAATNALKHASASLFEARLSLQPDGSLSLRLEDEGCGFDPNMARDGFGILGMRERAERIGAALCVESRSGGPTAVIVQLPPRVAAEGKP